MRKDEIRLSPKHGVNASVTICFWCNEPMGLALLGRLPGDAKAPREIVVDFTPCVTCVERRKAGITMIEVRGYAKYEDEEPYAPGLWATGRWAVVAEEAIRRMIVDDMAKQMLEMRVGMVEEQAFERLFVLPTPKGEPN